MKTPPLLPLSPNRVWRTYPGGKVLDQLEGSGQPDDSHFPEDWIGSTTCAANIGREHLVEEGLSKVHLGDETLTLKALLERDPINMLGKRHVEKFGAKTQFLLKFLDSAIRLHLQCHPTIAFAKKYLNSDYGKTEAYLILGVRDEVKEPYIYMGFQHPPDKEDFKRMIVQQDIDGLLSCFEKIPIQPGDVFLVPGGMPHAIGEGVFMIEIMEPTDLGVRLEFERGGYVLPEEARFMGRGIDFALTMFNYNETSVEMVKDKFFCVAQPLAIQNQSTEFALIDEKKTPCFSVNRITVSGQYVKEADSCYIGIVTNGSGTIQANGESWTVEKGFKFFVPYATDKVTFDSKDEMEVIATFPPE